MFCHPNHHVQHAVSALDLDIQGYVFGEWKQSVAVSDAVDGGGLRA